MVLGQSFPLPWLTWIFANGLAIFMSLPFFVAFLIHDLTRLRRLHSATVWGGAVAYLPAWIGWLIVQHTAAFAALAPQG